MNGIVFLALAVGYLSLFVWVDVKIGATKSWRRREKKMEILQGVLVMAAIGCIPGLEVIHINEYLMRNV